MIRIQHLGEEKEHDRARFRNLEELVTAVVRGEAEPRVIERLVVNSVPLPDEMLDRLEEIELDAIEQVEIESRTHREIARSSLESCVDYGQKLASALLGAGELFRAGRTEEGNGVYAEALDALWVLIYALCAAGRELGPAGAALEGVEGEIQPWLAELLDAQTHTDWIRVADYLEYEIAPLLEKWIGAAETALRETAADQEKQ